jgi:hypothetical protein
LLRNGAPVEALVELQNEELLLSDRGCHECSGIIQNLSQCFAEVAGMQLGAGESRWLLREAPQDSRLLFVFPDRIVRMVGSQFHDLLIVGQIQRGGAGDAKIEQADPSRGLLKDVELLRLDILVASGDTRIMTSSEDDLVEFLVQT